MSDVKNKRVNIYIDQGAAEQALVTLQLKADKLTKSIEAGRQAGKNMAADIAKLSDTKSAIQTVQDQIDKGLRPSFAQTQAQVTKLRNELKRMSEDAPGYAEKFKSFQAARAELDRMTTSFKGVEQAQSHWMNEIKAIAFGVSIANVFRSVIAVLKETIVAIVTLNSEFESSLANLSAITGATGNDLDFLRQSAIDLSKSGARSAKDFVEAFKLIASAKPELLTAKEDLVAVTEAANLLANASGLELPDAATRLTDALNQFSLPAAAATKVVDALAAASKYGAAEVPQVTDALLQFGTQAKSSNINIYESSAAIELLAEKGIKGAEAGVKLRNVFLNLSAVDALPKSAIEALKNAGVNTDILKDKSLSLEQRLQELSKIAGDATSLVNVFGKENFNAGQIVLQNIPRYAELAKQIKEQGVASQQAATNTDTLAIKWEKFKNLLSSFVLDNTIGNVLKSLVDGLSFSVKQMSNSFEAGIASAKAFYNFTNNSLGLLKDIATFDFSSAKNRVQFLKDTEAARQKEIRDSKDLTDSKKEAAKIAADLSVSDIQTQQKRLDQQMVLYNAAEKNREALKQSGKATSEELRKAGLEVNKNADIVIALQKQISDAKKSTTKDSVIAPPEKDADIKKEESKREALVKELKDFEFELSQVGKQADDSEIARITKKYNDLITKAAQYSVSVIDLEKEKNSAIAILQDQEQKKRQEIIDKQVAATQKQANEDTYKSFLQDAVKNGEDLKQQKLQDYSNGIIDKKTFEESIKKIDIDTLEFEIGIAQSFVSVSKQAGTDLVKFKKDLNKQEIADRVRTKEQLETLAKKDELAGAQVNVLKTKPGTKARLDANLALLEVEKKQALDAENLTQNEIELIKEQYRQKEAKASLDFYAGQVNEVLTYLSKGLDVLSKFNEGLNAGENANLKKELAANDAKKASFKKQLDNKLISQQQYNQRVNELDAQSEKSKDELAKKQFERNKKIQIAQAIINGALGVTAVLAALPGATDILSLGAFRAINIGLTLATTAAEIYAISKTKYGKGGIMTGPSHSNGGMPVINPVTGQKEAEVEGGEYILSKATVANNRNLADALLHTSLHRNGAALPWNVRPYKTINYEQVTQSMQKVKFATGGVFAASTQNSTQPTAGTDPALLETLVQTRAVNALLIDTVANLQQTLHAGIDARVSLHKIDVARAQKDRINEASILK